MWTINDATEITFQDFTGFFFWRGGSLGSNAQRIPKVCEFDCIVKRLHRILYAEFVKSTFKLSVHSCLHVVATQWGLGPVAQGPQHGKNHISIEQVSCSAGVIAHQSRNL